MRLSRNYPELAEDMRVLMEQGYSLTAAAGKLGFTRSSIYNYARDNPEFDEILELAKAQRMAFWEGRLIAAESQPIVTSSIFVLKNASEEWRVVERLEVTGANGAALQIENADMLRSLTQDDREVIREILTKAARVKMIEAKRKGAEE